MALKMGEYYTPSHGQAHGRQTDGPAPGNPGTPDMRRGAVAGRGGMVKEIPAEMDLSKASMTELVDHIDHVSRQETRQTVTPKPIGAGAMLDRIDASLDGLSNLLSALEEDLEPLCIPPNGNGLEAEKQPEMLYPGTGLGEALNSIDCRIKAFTRRIYDIRSDLRL